MNLLYGGEIFMVSEGEGDEKETRFFRATMGFNLEATLKNWRENKKVFFFESALDSFERFVRNHAVPVEVVAAHITEKETVIGRTSAI